MVQIVVSGEILDQMRLARGAVELVDPQGNRVGTAEPSLSKAEILEMLERSRHPNGRYTTAEVVAKLQRAVVK